MSSINWYLIYVLHTSTSISFFHQDFWPCVIIQSTSQEHNFCRCQYFIHSSWLWTIPGLTFAVLCLSLLRRKRPSLSSFPQFNCTNNGCSTSWSFRSSIIEIFNHQSWNILIAIQGMWINRKTEGQTWVRSRSRLRLYEAGSQASGSRLRLRLPDFKKAWLRLWLRLLALKKPRLRLWLRVCGFGSAWYIIPPVNSCWNDMYCFLWVKNIPKTI